jgi:hypothetical protein
MMNLGSCQDVLITWFIARVGCVRLALGRFFSVCPRRLWRTVPRHVDGLLRVAMSSDNSFCRKNRPAGGNVKASGSRRLVPFVVAPLRISTGCPRTSTAFALWCSSGETRGRRSIRVPLSDCVTPRHVAPHPPDNFLAEMPLCWRTGRLAERLSRSVEPGFRPLQRPAGGSCS